MVRFPEFAAKLRRMPPPGNPPHASQALQPGTAKCRAQAAARRGLLATARASAWMRGQ